MREQSLPNDPDVLASFPGARSYERGEDAITYLAERGGHRYLVTVPDDPSRAVTVLEFADEHERAAHLAARSAPAVT